MPPDEIHAYRVTCGTCGLFVGWGTELQLRQIRQARRLFELDVFVVEPPPATLQRLELTLITSCDDSCGLHDHRISGRGFETMPLTAEGCQQFSLRLPQLVLQHFQQRQSRL